MARYQFVLLASIIFYNVNLNFGESVHVIVGDAVTFPATDKCQTGKPAELHRVVGHGTRLVARCDGNDWNATKGYEDRVNPNSSLAFSRTVYTDTGVYLLKCNGREYRIHLYVVEGFEASLTEGVQGKLPCYFSTDEVQRADSLRWEKHGETVLERDLSTGEITYGTGFNKETVTLYPNGTKEGEWSLIFLHPQMEDEGDYFCYVLKNGLKEKWGRPAAVRMKVTEKKNPDQTTTPPSGSTPHGQIHTENGTWRMVAIIAVVMVVMIAASWLGWCLKFWRARKSSGSGGERPSDVEEPLNREPPSPANGSNRVNGVAHSSHAESIF